MIAADIRPAQTEVPASVVIFDAAGDGALAEPGGPIFTIYTLKDLPPGSFKAHNRQVVTLGAPSHTPMSESCLTGGKVLLRFRVANYASLRDEQELSLVALDEHGDLAVRSPTREDLSVLPAVAIYGGNASGKSNLLQALRFMANAVEESHQLWKPGAHIRRNNFRFDEKSHINPTEFSVDIALDGVRYEYGFSLDDHEIKSEWLYSFTRQQRLVRRLIFERAGPQGSSIRFGESLKGRKRAIADLVRPNSLYLSTAAANNHEQLTRIYRWFESDISYVAAGHPHQNPIATLHGLSEHGRKSVLSLLNYADFGITDVRHEQQPFNAEIRERFLALIKVMDPENAADESVEVQGPPKIDFVHRVNEREYTLSADHESSGTRGWFALLGPVVNALSLGKLLVVDELNAFLHPLLASELLKLFQSPTYNKLGAQILFNTHDVTLMSPLADARLRRDQIWLADRASDGATELHPLTRYRVREGLDNVFRGYMLGRYRGVPIFDDHFLERALRGHTGSHVAPQSEQAPETDSGKPAGQEALPRLL
ncbi:ATP-binding protein [Streptosporangium sp. NPDC049078]|uniref:AAA family ATPase n=1 Tax=Streptosporangium sp. NPDC049078 TaxID=3155767 RepID=UPI00343C81F0